MEMIFTCMTWVPSIWDQLRILFAPYIRINVSLFEDAPFLDDGFVRCNTITGNDFPEQGKNDNKEGDNPPSKDLSISKSFVPSGSGFVEHTPSPLASGSLLNIPDDIVMDILSRLSAECAYKCQHVCKAFRSLLSTPSFVAMHLHRASPILVVQCFREHGRIDPKGSGNVLHFIDGCEVVVASRWYKQPNEWKRVLIGSYNGLLLFRTVACVDSKFFIWNPITQEEVTVILPNVTDCVCGFFFHTPTEEYRLIYICSGWLHSKYMILCLRTKLIREIASLTVVPRRDRSPIMLNGVLHWMVSEDRSKGRFDNPSSCSKSIMTFKIDSEEFFTMPHPGDECGLRKRHEHMQLLEMDGHLCLCDILSSTELYLWVLEDYEKQLWVKVHKVDIKPLVRGHFLGDSTLKPWLALQALYIHRGEMLVKWNLLELFYYNLKQNTFRKVEKDRIRKEHVASVVVHTNSMASLNTDRLIFVEDGRSVEQTISLWKI